MVRLRPSDRIGEILNNRKIIDVIKVDSRNKYVWECCECGSVAQGEYANLKKEVKNHCGCLGSSRRRGVNNHLYKHGKTKSSEYTSWHLMKRRLTVKSDKSYDHYINNLKIDADPRWLDSFEAFYADMGDKPNPKFTLERINAYRGYWPDNCRWASKEEQAQNKTTTFWCVYKGEKISLSSLCEQLELKYITVYMRIKRGHRDPFFGVTDVKILGVIS